MRTFRLMLCLFLVVMMTGCTGQKKVLYFQDLSSKDTMVVQKNYEMKISYDDKLGISITCSSPELAAPFMGQSVSSSSGPAVGPHSIECLVDSRGDIEFPILGKMHVMGMTRLELMEYIKQRLISEEYIKDPSVSVRFLNFKVSVLGAVGSPGPLSVESDRITILEAISKSGDLAITGRRDRVVVLREENGLRIPYYLDLRSKNVFESPCFYLKQNDLVYVEPNKIQTKQSNRTELKSLGFWTSLVSFISSIGAIIFVAD